MIVNSNEMLKEAKEKHYAVPHFNINNLEWTRYILEACEEENSPVILGVSEGAIKYMGGYNTVVNLIVWLVYDLKISIPVVIHLDHGSSIQSCKDAIDAGFTSVMIDGSLYDLETNIYMTNEVMRYAKLNNVSVEAEIGHIGGIEDTTSSEIAYAKVDDCIELAIKTKVDSLAPALGSVHGIYKGEPVLDFTKMAAISSKTSLPLVLHGGTGIYDDQIRKSISSGVCKVNINTELQMVWADEVRNYIMNNPDVYDPRKIIGSGASVIKMAVKRKIQLLKNK